MRTENSLTQFDISILEEQTQLTLEDLCCACSLSSEHIIKMVDSGVLEPIGREPAHWHFDSISLNRARVALRLQQDIGVDLIGAALVLELLDEIELLRTRLRAAGAEYPSKDYFDE